jgi:3-deoxy-D-manno-octulosonic-acid transferase
LRQIDLVAAQNDEYARRFLELGAAPSAVHVTGSIKYDGAQTDRHNPATDRLRKSAGIGDDDVVFLAGSTQVGEEAAALAAYQSLSREFPKLRLIVVPRHPERFAAVAQLLDSSRVAWQRRSRLDPDGPRPEASVLLVDTVGELGAWWGVAAIAFVGGSLGSRGGQNMIEPAAYGAAVSFGPNTRNFHDIVAALLAHQAAVVVRDEHELTAFVRRCLADEEYRRSLGRAARQLVASQAGATARTLALLAPLVEPKRNKAAA